MPDIIFLIRHLKVKSAKDVLDLVAQYYPANRIPVKTQYLVEGRFNGLRSASDLGASCNPPPQPQRGCGNFAHVNRHVGHNLVEVVWFD